VGPKSYYDQHSSDNSDELFVSMAKVSNSVALRKSILHFRAELRTKAGYAPEKSTMTSTM
jgi:hypothetical protein